MKFGRRLLEEAEEGFQRHYIAYKELKKAIKLITGNDTSQFTITEVTSNFGNIPALAGSTYRPPESRFQDLLNFEVNKINNFSALIYAAIGSALRIALRQLASGAIKSREEWRNIRDCARSCANATAFLHSYVHLNLVGFRKITKKYDKHNGSNAAPFYLARLIKEPFVNLNFDFLIELVSITFVEVRHARNSIFRSEGTAPEAIENNLADGAENVSDSDDSLEDGCWDSDAPLNEESSIPRDAANEIVSPASGIPPAPSAQPVPCANETQQVRKDSTATSAPSIQIASGETRRGSPNNVQTTYLVGEEDLMRVRVCLAQHLPLVCHGGSIAEAVEAFTGGVPGHHQLGSNMKEVIPRDIKDAMALIERLVKPLPGVITVQERGEISFLSPAVYKNETARFTMGCAYFDSPDQAIYKRALSGPRASTTEVLRLRWELTAERENPCALLEFVRVFESADSMATPWESLYSESSNVPPDSGAPDAANDSRVVIYKKQLPLLLSGDATVQNLLVSLPRQLPHRNAEQTLRRALVLINGPQQQRPVFLHWAYRSVYCSFRPIHTTTVTGSVESAAANTGSYFNAFLEENVKFVEAGPLLSDIDMFWSPPHLAFTCAELHAPPYGVLAVSVPKGFSPPLFLARITGLTTVAEVYRYSPLLHGEAVFHKLPRNQQPRWLSFLLANELEETDKSRNLREEATAAPVRVDVSNDARPGGRRLLHEEEAAAAPPSPPASGPLGRSSQQSFQVKDHAGAAQTDVMDTEESKRLRSNIYVIDTPSRAQSTARTPLLIGLTQPPRQTTVSSVGALQIYCQPLLDWIRDIGNETAGWLWPQERNGVTTVGSSAVRVEPKTFFANERTFLQWMNTAVLLSTISITLLNFGTATGRTAGLVMAPVALFFIGYAFLVYLRRSKALERKEPINYNDRLGPAVLVACLVGALSAIIALNIFHTGHRHSTQTLNRSVPTPSPARAKRITPVHYLKNEPEIVEKLHMQLTALLDEIAEHRNSTTIQTVLPYELNRLSPTLNRRDSSSFPPDNNSSIILSDEDSINAYRSDVSTDLWVTPKTKIMLPKQAISQDTLNVAVPQQQVDSTPTGNYRGFRGKLNS